MNNDMYQLVKQEIAKGTPIQEILDSVKDMTDCAKDELKDVVARQATSDEVLRAAQSAIVGPNRKIDEAFLITLLGAYFVQNGVNADLLADNYGDYRAMIRTCLTTDIQTLRQTADLAAKAKNGASESELLHDLFKTASDNLKGLFNSEPNFWQL